MFLHVDSRTPVAAVREEFRRVVEASAYWNEDVCALHVTDADGRGVELRAIASAPDAPQLWELRCEVREALVAYLREEHLEALPVVRMQGGPSGRAVGVVRAVMAAPPESVRDPM